jgi:heterodisulfide reductase subunit A
MVILNTALEPRIDAEKVAQTLGISRSGDGFFLESYIKLDPVTTTDGIYLAGCCQSPKDIPDSVAQGSAAASQALSIIATSKVKVSPISASIDSEQCAGCRICLGLCPYRAIKLNEETLRAEINAAVCKVV